MKILNAIRELVRKMFPSKSIKEAYSVDIAVTDLMLRHITEWDRMYFGKASWLSQDVISLRLEQGIVREFANITLNEMTATVTDDNINEIFQKAIEDINQNLQKALATGATIIKPLGGNNVQYVPQTEFVPIEYDVNGRLMKVIFPEIKRISEHEYLIRLEYHSLDPEKGLTITNRAFRSSSPDSLGKEIPLDSVPEWSSLIESVTYPLMKRPAFGYYVNPIANTIDGGHGGVSIFDSAKQLIRLADIQFGRLDWEFDSAERAVHVDATALRPVDSVPGLKGLELPKLELPKLKDRLYKGLNISGGTQDFFQEYSPALREESFIKGLEEYKRAIEFTVGLSYGDLSNPQAVEKTATEVKAAKKRKYNTVSAIQKNLKDCLGDLVYALAFFNAMATRRYEFICDFKDSILVDEETERQQDRNDVSMGIMRPEEYRAKWYGESLEKALENLPQSAEVIE